MASLVFLKNCLLMCILVSGSVCAQQRFKISRLDHLVITVMNATRSADFYTKILGMELRVSPWGMSSVYFGKSKINIHEVGSEFLPKAKLPTPGSADLCFITDTDIDQYIKHLKCHRVSIIEGPVGRPGALGPITSVYFSDPDGNLIEVSKY